jgi:dihydroorotase-like cyclic amidohydrolase
MIEQTGKFLRQVMSVGLLAIMGGCATLINMPNTLESIGDSSAASANNTAQIAAGQAVTNAKTQEMTYLLRQMLHELAELKRKM